jgi:hypothetical protein
MSTKREGTAKSARSAVFISFAAIAIIVAVVVLVPTLDQPRIPYNHLRAAHWTRHLIAAEHHYAGSFPLVGFTCDLRRLAEAGLVDKVLASGDKSGYHYELRGCSTTTTVVAFAVAALPTKAGITGQFAFCGNQEGVVWYADNGSADHCLHQRVRWTKADPLQD